MFQQLIPTLALVLAGTMIPGHATTLLAPQQGHVGHDHSPSMMTTTLFYSGQWSLGNGWAHTLDVHVESTGEVWGEGYAEDPTTLDPTGAPTKWFSYSWENGVFDFVGADGTAQLRASFGPSDVEWSQDNEGNWIADIAEPGSGPQPLWPVVALAVAVAVALSGDGGCSCGHNGGTDNHPGTNHP